MKRKERNQWVLMAMQRGREHFKRYIKSVILDVPASKEFIKAELEKYDEVIAYLRRKCK